MFVYMFSMFLYSVVGGTLRTMAGGGEAGGSETTVNTTDSRTTTMNKGRTTTRSEGSLGRRVGGTVVGMTVFTTLGSRTIGVKINSNASLILVFYSEFKECSG